MAVERDPLPVTVSQFTDSLGIGEKTTAEDVTGYMSGRDIPAKTLLFHRLFAP